ncbi:hypothetical protein THTE_1524 [Thermogutta terrifontis]|uniref:Uncharacterized protein n=1 Tax=Thermogutta terrifontis TaxID=1331910 RepID=A0A286RDT4_9BACT|nr:hypothetical protein THTE_1524 [Thermogutta terrifontis]
MAAVMGLKNGLKRPFPATTCGRAKREQLYFRDLRVGAIHE